MNVLYLIILAALALVSSWAAASWLGQLRPRNLLLGTGLGLLSLYLSLHRIGLQAGPVVDVAGTPLPVFTALLAALLPPLAYGYGAGSRPKTAAPIPGRE